MPLFDPPFQASTPQAEGFALPHAALSALPLQGITLLAVEDSRYASDALRLLCQRSGARLRRAETLEAAWAHLRVYRPDVVLVDIGLPDGRGDLLIRRLALCPPPRPVVLGLSGDPEARGAALAAGADGFLEKPVGGVSAFQAAILAHLPDRSGQVTTSGEVEADPLALHDDLVQAVEALQASPSPAERRYLAGFLSGLARQTRDPALSAATAALVDVGTGTVIDGLTRLIDERLSRSEPFRPAG